MSMQDALIFLKQIADEPNLQEAIRGGEGATIQALAQSRGLTVTAEELRRVALEVSGRDPLASTVIPRHMDESLSDADLDLVAGGLDTRTILQWVRARLADQEHDPLSFSG